MSTVKTIQSHQELWNYYKSGTTSDAVGNINYSIKDSESVNYKTSIIGRLQENNVEKENC